MGIDGKAEVDEGRRPGFSGLAVDGWDEWRAVLRSGREGCLGNYLAERDRVEYSEIRE